MYLLSDGNNTGNCAKGKTGNHKAVIAMLLESFADLLSPLGKNGYDSTSSLLFIWEYMF